MSGQTFRRAFATSNALVRHRIKQFTMAIARHLAMIFRAHLPAANISSNSPSLLLRMPLMSTKEQEASFSR